MFDFNTLPKIVDDKGFAKAIDAINTTYASKNASALLHRALEYAVNRAVEVNGADMLTNMFIKLHANVNKLGIRLWVRTFTTMDWKPAGDGKAKFLGEGKVYAWKQDAGSCNGWNTPFYTMSSVKKANEKPYSLDTILVTALDTARRKQKGGKVVDTNDNTLADMLADVLAKHHNALVAAPPAKGRVVQPQLEAVAA